MRKLWEKVRHKWHIWHNSHKHRGLKRKKCVKMCQMCHYKDRFLKGLKSDTFDTQNDTL